MGLRVLVLLQTVHLESSKLGSISGSEFPDTQLVSAGRSTLRDSVPGMVAVTEPHAVAVAGRLIPFQSMVAIPGIPVYTSMVEVTFESPET